jgi:hypothetical protein
VGRGWSWFGSWSAAVAEAGVEVEGELGSGLWASSGLKYYGVPWRGFQRVLEGFEGFRRVLEGFRGF